MSVILRVMVFAALLWVTAANGQTIYRCEANGRTTFSDKPCDSSATGRGSAARKTTAPPPSSEALDAPAGYATPHGLWRGQAQYQAKVGTQLVEDAHAVVPIVLSIQADGKVSGGSPDNGCRLLGIASPVVGKIMLKLDVTLSQCKYAPLNRRYGGFIVVYAKEKMAQLNLDAHIIRSGSPPRFFDLRGTLRR